MPYPAAGAKAAALTTKRNQSLMVAVHAQKAMLKSAAFEEIFENLLDILVNYGLVTPDAQQTLDCTAQQFDRVALLGLVLLTHVHKPMSPSVPYHRHGCFLTAIFSNLTLIYSTPYFNGCLKEQKFWNHDWLLWVQAV